jgi:hypothetical protein
VHILIGEGDNLFVGESQITQDPRIAQRDGRRAKSELRSESCSELGVSPGREGKNSEMESKKGRREEGLRKSQEKKP